jgi:hypothetical protein
MKQSSPRWRGSSTAQMRDKPDPRLRGNDGLVQTFRQRIPRRWIEGLLLATGSVLLFLGGPGYDSSRSFLHGWDIGHIIYFFLFSGVLVRWSCVARRPLAAQWAIVLASTVVLGSAIELLQGDVGRSPEVGDVVRDLVGSLIVLTFAAPSMRLHPPAWRNGLRIVVLALLLAQLWPVVRSLLDEEIARRQFPLLSGFATPFEEDRWVGDATRSVVSDPSIAPGRVLKISFTTDPYSVVALKYFAGDWTVQKWLEFSLYNPDRETLQVTVRIHDRQHHRNGETFSDRFNHRYLLQPGWNPVAIDLAEVAASPAGRRMDMSRIRGVAIFVKSLPGPRTIYLDNLRLVP